MAAKVSDGDFIAIWKRLGSPADVAKATGLDIRQVYSRRNALENKLGVILNTNDNRNSGRAKVSVPKQGFRALSENIVGRVIVGSDMHAWPGERSVAFGALVELVKELKPAMVVMNGDSFDGARISRHPPGGWCHMPSVADELEAVKERHAEIEAAAPVNIPLIWPAGNHDSRYGARLAQQAPEYIGIDGFDIADHFPAWQFCWSLWINGHTVVKHRWHQGVHGAYNNVLKSGKNIVTGHTHRLQATMFADYNGLRYGVETGTLSEMGPETDKFAYSEDSPANHSQGFVVLSFAKNGMLLEPEFCRVINDVAYFRGEAIHTRQGMVKAA